jgi:amidophosphoribosyltransferase
MDLVTRRIILELDGPQADIAAYRDPDGEPYKRMVEEMRKRLKVYSLAFQRLEDVVKAIGLGYKRVCTYCWTGEDPSMGCKGACKGCNGACSCS